MKNVLILLFTVLFFQNIILAKDNSIKFPVFTLLKMDSISTLSNTDISLQKNTIFINFSPTCDHCERTIKSILENINKFTETQIILSSFEDFGLIRKFYFDNGLSSFTNVFVGQEIDYNLTKQIKYSSFPCIIIFDKNQQFIKKIDEETNAKYLLKVLHIKNKN